MSGRIAFLWNRMRPMPDAQALPSDREMESVSSLPQDVTDFLAECNSNTNAVLTNVATYARGCVSI